MEEFKKLLYENLEYSKKNFELMRKIKSQLLWQQILGWVKAVIIIVPLVLAIIYAVPYVRQALNMYESAAGLIGGGGPKSMNFLKGIGNDLNGLDLDKLMK